MGKQSAPAAPDYTPIATANMDIANQQFELGKDQMAQSQKMFDVQWPYAQKFLDQQTASSAAQTANAAAQQDYYDKTYKPLETQFTNTASGYNSADRADQNAGMAMGDVAASFDSARTAALSNLESFGIDPSQTRYSALDLGTRISQAAASAGANTQSRLNTQATGLALQGEAINVGRGYPSAIANSYNTATNSGSSGLGTANGVINTQSAGAGMASNIMGGATASNSAAASALNMGFQNNLAGAKFEGDQSAAAWKGIGSVVGAVAMAAML